VGTTVGGRVEVQVVKCLKEIALSLASGRRLTTCVRDMNDATARHSVYRLDFKYLFTVLSTVTSSKDFFLADRNARVYTSRFLSRQGRRSSFVEGQSKTSSSVVDGSKAKRYIRRRPHESKLSVAGMLGNEQKLRAAGILIVWLWRGWVPGFPRGTPRCSGS
jgi:hypothetical protein